MAHDIQKQPDGSLMMCCGKKTCPTILFGEDGIGATIKNDDGAETVFTDAQLDALAHLIETRKERR